MSNKVAVALGSNLGDRRAHLDAAIAVLSGILTNLRVSTVIESDPVDVPDQQPPYLNAVAVGETELEPEALLDALMWMERARGRERKSLRAARTLDLDIILYGDRVVQTPSLEIPHPRFRERDFVLAPLAELEPEWIDPVTHTRVKDLLDRTKSKKP
jgi:2-amino-4-hydroxy-6-hydroxymethyldihydropteridine diphosphokinase